ncbi:hypothetical protein GVAV_002036 [Gurleya vavrai]
MKHLRIVFISMLILIKNSFDITIKEDKLIYTKPKKIITKKRKYGSCDQMETDQSKSDEYTDKVASSITQSIDEQYRLNEYEKSLYLDYLLFYFLQELKERFGLSLEILEGIFDLVIIPKSILESCITQQELQNIKNTIKPVITQQELQNIENTIKLVFSTEITYEFDIGMHENDYKKQNILNFYQVDGNFIKGITLFLNNYFELIINLNDKTFFEPLISFLEKIQILDFKIEYLLFDYFFSKTLSISLFKFFLIDKTNAIINYRKFFSFLKDFKIKDITFEKFIVDYKIQCGFYNIQKILNLSESIKFNINYLFFIEQSEIRPCQQFCGLKDFFAKIKIELFNSYINEVRIDQKDEIAINFNKKIEKKKKKFKKNKKIILDTNYINFFKLNHEKKFFKIEFDFRKFCFDNFKIIVHGNLINFINISTEKILNAGFIEFDRFNEMIQCTNKYVVIDFKNLSMNKLKIKIFDIIDKNRKNITAILPQCHGFKFFVKKNNIIEKNLDNLDAVTFLYFLCLFESIAKLDWNSTIANTIDKLSSSMSEFYISDKNFNFELNKQYKLRVKNKKVDNNVTSDSVLISQIKSKKREVRENVQALYKDMQNESILKKLFILRVRVEIQNIFSILIKPFVDENVFKQYSKMIQIEYIRGSYSFNNMNTKLIGFEGVFLVNDFIFFLSPLFFYHLIPTLKGNQNEEFKTSYLGDKINMSFHNLYCCEMIDKNYTKENFINEFLYTRDKDFFYLLKNFFENNKELYKDKSVEITGWIKSFKNDIEKSFENVVKNQINLNDMLRKVYFFKKNGIKLLNNFNSFYKDTEI